MNFNENIKVPFDYEINLHNDFISISLQIAKKVFQRNIATFHQKPSSHIVFDEDVEDAEKIDKVNEEIEKKKEENGESETKEYISAAVEITTKD